MSKEYFYKKNSTWIKYFITNIYILPRYQKNSHGDLHMAIIKEVQCRSIDLTPIPTITFQ